MLRASRSGGVSGAERNRTSLASLSRPRPIRTLTDPRTWAFTIRGSREAGVKKILRYNPGQRVCHSEHGEGVVLAAERNGYVRAFFGGGERLVAVDALQSFQQRTERVIAAVEASDERRREAWLGYEAHALPLMESAAALTSAPIDLLPHQVVLTHRIATASPRRFLVADEVGLGKTIETALLLRELASREEMNRALLVVPAGLVNNWHREMNEVFHLNFEVFGSEGDAPIASPMPLRNTTGSSPVSTRSSDVLASNG